MDAREPADVIAQDGDLRIRRLRDRDDDYEMLARWLNTPHVREWWDPDDPAATAQSVAAEYRPLTQPDSATTPCIIELDGRAIGYIQFYPWSADADWAKLVGIEWADGDWGLDVLIGEPDAVGRDIGTRVVDLVCRHAARAHAATALMLVTETTNGRAQRAYEKAGFQRVAEILDTDTRNGERVRSYVMRRQTHTLTPDG